MSNDTKSERTLEIRIENIKYGQYALPMGIDEGSNLYMTYPAIEQCLGYSVDSFRKILNSKQLKSFLGSYSVTPVKGCIVGHEEGSLSRNPYRNLVKLEDFDKIVDFEVSRGNEKAIRLKGYAPRKAQSTLKGKEKSIQHRLAEKLNGEIEVVTPVGCIDVLTSTELIEVKAANQWKSALGQVLSYGYFYPSHRKRIHLFGITHSRVQKDIESICSEYNVVVTYEARGN